MSLQFYSRWYKSRQRFWQCMKITIQIMATGLKPIYKSAVTEHKYGKIGKVVIWRYEQISWSIDSVRVKNTEFLYKLTFHGWSGIWTRNARFEIQRLNYGPQLFKGWIILYPLDKSITTG